MNAKWLKHPSTILGILGAVLATAAAFGAPVTEAQTHAILVFGGSLSLIAVTNGAAATVRLAPQTLTALVAAAIGVAIAFGMNLTSTQQTDLLNLTGAVSLVLLGHGAVSTAVRGMAARRMNATSGLASVVGGSITGKSAVLKAEGLFVLYTYQPAAGTSPPACHVYGPATAAVCVEEEARLKASLSEQAMKTLPLEDFPAKAAEDAQVKASGLPTLEPGPGGPVA